MTAVNKELFNITVKPVSKIGTFSSQNLYFRFSDCDIEKWMLMDVDSGIADPSVIEHFFASKDTQCKATKYLYFILFEGLVIYKRISFEILQIECE